MNRSATIVAVVVALPLGGCDLGWKTTSQTGFRGAGLQQITDRDTVREAAATPAPPYELPADEGPPASQTYQNVQVLGNVSTEQFNLLMAQMNQWIAPGDGPEQGCNYCHDPANMASDAKYTKIVSRQMLRMTRDLNTRWASHVQDTGVTCWTCHRGNAVPENVWALADPPSQRGTIVGNRDGQNRPDSGVGYSSLPYDPFEHYLGTAAEVKIASNSRHPSPNHVVSLKEAEQSYGLMMHVSQSLGVNCTYCHNSQSFRQWSLSSGQRATAYYGIRMVRDVNANYITPLQSVFPSNRKGPHGDVYKVNCLTCHQGLAKPLNGVSMLAEAPSLRTGTIEPDTAETLPGAEVREAFRDPKAITESQ